MRKELEEFVDRLIKLVKLERDAEISAMLQEMSKLTGEEREEKGNAVLGLQGHFAGEEFGYYLVRFGRRKEIDTNIGPGDVVLISKGDPLKSNYTGVVVEKGNRFITVAVDRLPAWKLKDVRLDLYVSDITYRRQIENLVNLSPQGERVLEFLLGFAQPSQGRAENFEPFDKELNESQRRAISLALGSDDFFLVHGPFGTGKTRTLAEYVRQEVARGRKVLVTAESNMAVDNLVERLWGVVKLVRVGHPSRVSKHLVESTLAHQIANDVFIQKLREELASLVEERDRYARPIPSIRRGLSDEKILKYAAKGRGARGISREKMRELAEWIKINRKIQSVVETIEEEEEELARKILDEAEVVLSTNSSVALEVLEGFEFDVVVVDEASQATIPSILIPLSRGERFVLAGDHRQLPPTILSEEAKELSETLFERLMNLYGEKSSLLNVQYRMNELLMEFPNREFYAGKLLAGESVRYITLADLDVKDAVFDEFWNAVISPKNVLVFIDTRGREDRFERQREGSTSRENHLEARLVTEIVEKLLEVGVKEEWVGVITPYDDQVDLLDSLLPEGVEIHSVDGFQGREKEVIVISFVRSNLEGEIGFLNDLRRLNVSLTRAKRKLIVVGDSSTLSVHPTYSRFINFVKEKGTYVAL